MDALKEIDAWLAMPLRELMPGWELAHSGEASSLGRVAELALGQHNQPSQLRQLNQPTGLTGSTGLTSLTGLTALTGLTGSTGPAG